MRWLAYILCGLLVGAAPTSGLSPVPHDPVVGPTPAPGLAEGIRISGSSEMGYYTGTTAWGLGDSFTLAFWLYINGTQTSAQVAYFDLGPSAHDITKIMVFKDTAASVLSLIMYDSLASLRLDLDHTTTVSSMEDGWHRVIIWKVRNVFTRFVIDGSVASGAGNFVTLSATRELRFGDSVRVDYGQGDFTVGPVYMWDFSISNVTIDLMMSTYKFGWNPKIADVANGYDQDEADGLTAWIRPCGKNAIAPDYAGTITDLAAVGGLATSDCWNTAP